MRVFISINIDTKTKEDITAIQQNLKKKIRNPENVRFDSPKNFHLTLFFIGEIDKNSLQLINDALRKNTEGKFGKLNFECRQINAFPNLNNPKVIFLNCRNTENKIFDLSEKIKTVLNKFGIKQDKPFYPHITLVRVREKIKIADASDLNIDIKFSAAKLSIMQSELTPKGAIHEEVFAINL